MLWAQNDTGGGDRIRVEGYWGIEHRVEELLPETKRIEIPDASHTMQEANRLAYNAVFWKA